MGKDRIELANELLGKELDPKTSLPKNKIEAADLLIEKIQPSIFESGRSLENQEDFSHQIHANTDNNAIRADSQSWLAQAGNGVVGGVLSGLATAVQDFSYIPQLFSSHWEENAVSDAMIRAKEGIDEALPIYTKTDGLFDWNDGAFVWKALKGTLDSAVGFAIPGGVVSKGLGTLGKVAKLEKLAGLLSKSPQVYDAMMSLGTGYVMNRMEGTMMGVELYNNSMKEMEGDIASGKITQQDAERIASQKADEFRNWNTMFAITDAIGVHGIIKGEGFTRNIKSQGLNAFKELSTSNPIVQALKESAEEIGQNIMQREKEYETYNELGLKTKADNLSTNKTLVGRIIDFGTSSQALYEGMLGAFGGYPQHVLTKAVSGGYGKTARDKEQSYLDTQKDMISKNETYLNGLNEITTEYHKLKQEALKKGDTKAAEALDKMNFTNMLVQNFKAGTTENLERTIQDITELTPEKATERGYNSDYRTKAQELSKQLKEAENEWLNTSRYNNHEQVFFERQNKKILTSLYDKEFEISESKKQNVNKEAVRLVQKYNNIIKNDLGHDILGLNFDINNIDNPSLSSEIVKPYYEAFKNELKSTSTYDDYFTHKNTTLKETEDALETSNAKYKLITSPEYQEVIKINEEEKLNKAKLDAEATKIAEKAVAKKAKEDKALENLKAKEAAELKAKETITNNNPISTPFIPEEVSNPDTETETTPISLGNMEFTSGSEESENTPNTEVENIEYSISQIEEGYQKKVEDLISKGATQEEANSIVASEMSEEDKIALDKLYSQLDELLNNQLTTNEEKVIVEVAKQTQTVITNQLTEQEYTEDLADDVLAIETNLENEISNENLSQDEIETKKSEFGSNILAYLSRKFQGFVSRLDLDNVLNENLKDKSILDPNKFTVGTEITLEIKDNDAVKMYIPGTKTITTWGEYKFSNPELTKGSVEYNNLVPIVVKDNKGNEIADLHNIDWIRFENIYGDTDEDSKRLAKIREYIINNGGKVKSKITRRTNGKLFKLINNATETVANAFPENLHFTFLSKGEIKNLPAKIAKLLNPKFSLKEGVTYIVIPINNDNYVPIPLQQKKVSEQIANSISKVIEIWYKHNANLELTSVENEIINNLYNNYENINIKNIEDVRKYITYYINSFNIPLNLEARSKAIAKANNISPLAAYLNSTGVNSNTALLSVTSNSIDFGNGTGSKSAFSLSKNTPPEVAEKIISKLTEHIQNMYMHVNHNLITKENVKLPVIENESITDINKNNSYKHFIKNNTNTKFLSHNIGTEENPNYVYTIQPVIEFDTSFIDKPNESVVVNSSEEKPIVVKNKSEVKTVSIKNPITGIITINLNNDEDLLPLNNNNDIEYALKIVNILQSKKAEEVFKKGKKNGWDLNKILTELQVPKEQKQLTLDLNITENKANVILPIGTSGSGKSTFIKSLPQENLLVIEPDAMRVEFTGNINDKSKDKEIYEEAAKRAIRAIKQGKQVVFDTTNLTKDKRLPFIEAIKKAIPTANIQYKLMELNPELAKQRIKADIAAGKNRANVPDATIDRHAESYKQMLEDIKNEPISEFKSTDLREQLALELASNYSYTVEINTAKDKIKDAFGNVWVDEYPNKKIGDYVTIDNKEWKILGTRFEDDSWGESGLDERESFIVGNDGEPTQHYSNLTVNEDFYKNNPDWEYKEQRITTPLITPSIRGHAQFAEANDIGWFRAWYNKKTGEVHVLEVQSDLFQKGRDKQILAEDQWVGNTEDGPIIEEKKNENQFLQLLNKDNNWVTFFVKAIIQNTAKETTQEVQESDVEAKIRELEKEGLLEIDCKGKLKAEKGLATAFTKGGKWKVIKDLKGYPTHKEGGIDLTIGKDGVSIKNGNTQFTAKHGLVIPKN